MGINMTAFYRDQSPIVVLSIDGEEHEMEPSEALAIARDITDAASGARLYTPGKEYDHDARPDDQPEPGDRCKDCREDITWVGPSIYDWLHVDDKENR